MLVFMVEGAIKIGCSEATTSVHRLDRLENCNQRLGEVKCAIYANKSCAFHGKWVMKKGDHLGNCWEDIMK